MEKIIVLLELIGGAGILLYGIDIMKSGLEEISESKMERMLGALTKNRMMGILVGAVVTIINQKSVATTAMVVGFVNAGVITLIQALGVIMGANIGTTVTAQILAFDLEWAAPAVIGAGVILWRGFAHKKIGHFGEAMIGFGMMFIGMAFFGSALIPFAQIAPIKAYLINFDESSLIAYLTAIIIGFALAAISRSSSTIMGLIIAMGIQGIIGFDLAMPLILGVNTGKCLPTLYLGASVNRTARQATALQMMFYIIGDIIFILFFRSLMSVAVTSLAPEDIARQIAHAHTLFNLGNAILLLPFARLLVKASDRIIAHKNQGEEETNLNLDKRMLETPGLALAQTARELTVMANAVMNNFSNAFTAFTKQDEKLGELVLTEEDSVNLMQKEIESYLVKLSQKGIAKKQQRMINVYMSICADLERMGDLAGNLIRFEAYGKENEVHLSEEAMGEIGELHERILKMGTNVTHFLKVNDVALAKKTLDESKDLEEVQKKLKDLHLERLSKGQCVPGSGVVFIDLIADLISIANHIRSICNAVIDSEKSENDKE